MGGGALLVDSVTLQVLEKTWRNLQISVGLFPLLLSSASPSFFLSNKPSILSVNHSIPLSLLSPRSPFSPFCPVFGFHFLSRSNKNLHLD